MNKASNLIALISTDDGTIDQVKKSLAGTYDIDVFANGMALHYAIQNMHAYKAVISDDEVIGINGAPLRKTLIKLGYLSTPFIILPAHIDDASRQIALKENITDFFPKPLNQEALHIRVPFLIDNYNPSVVTAEKNQTFKLPLIKRIFDITFSSLALLLLSPLFLIIAVLIRLESKGAVFYYSLRVGTGYKVFRFYKFRSMSSGADAKLKELSHLNQYNTQKNEGQPVVAKEEVKEVCDICEQAGSPCRSPLFTDNKMVCEKIFLKQKAGKIESAFIKIKDDPRITKVGNFIRNTSIDELPQLWNVFIGDMSIVGNRPLPLYEAEKITTDKYALRFMAPAGITGLWQVEKRGRGEMSEDERLKLDNSYAKNHSFMNDIRLILKTIPALLQKESV
ncbi:MAG: sugar transferase [Lacibacter sp.]